ncbi:Outer membrane porin protein 32 [Paraburkholderia domus]|jgi:Outer membrane protein (porin)|uniref:porin n=1 Tax=Paraburkholderia domus TaxID=2793075 RepID=UPI001912CF29|nr:porin [Paraburkholderia domus]MBK5052759.1 porin [Burkholderia sp. R-70006]MBK5063533.1 porin [Burkholderia sp. R-70199]MBK5088476.1 porin [Burkholderia sp. R-69927]MBK5183633.1 porin [Burkholderia sp. R-69749]MCI0151372.1 porin [Paraburkholderia sediminicola]
MRFTSQGIFGATLLLAAGGVMAQSSVTLYGVADVFVQYLDNGGNHSYSERSGGSTGSLFGLKGNEDLGGGWKAVFDVENGFNINNGSFFADSTAMFYRQSWVGLKQDTYGSLTFGRQYQPSFWAVYFTDPFRGNEVMSPLAAADLASATDRSTLATQYVSGRTSNSIVYTSPDLRGAHFYAMYALPSTVTQPVPVSSGAMLDLAANYSGYGFYAGVGYQYQHGSRETAPLVATAPTLLTSFDLMATEHFSGAIAYRVGIVNFMFNYSYNRPKDAPAGALVTITPAVKLPLASLVHAYSIMELGATIQATPADNIEIAGIERDVRGVHDNTPGIEVGVDHSLSKRTSLYMRAGYLKNNGSANMSWPGVTGVAAGSKQVVAVLGMTHRF